MPICLDCGSPNNWGIRKTVFFFFFFVCVRDGEGRADFLVPDWDRYENFIISIPVNGLAKS